MREYLFVLLVAMAGTYLAVPAAYRLALRLNAFTQVRDRDVHTVPIPRLGGLAILTGYAAATLVATKLPFLSKVFVTPELWGVLLGGVLVCAVGAIDDTVELDALTKLAGQIVAAGVMAFSGVQLFSVPFLGVTTILPAPVLVLLTIFTVVVSTNAVNFIDGLDGLASGVVAIAAATFLIYSYWISGQFDPANVFTSSTFISAAPLGCCVGVLPHNVYPARLCMVDRRWLLRGGVRPWLARSAIVLVEGAGGLMSPLGEATYKLTGAAEIGLTIVIVVANRLGAINDALQTLITARVLALSSRIRMSWIVVPIATVSIRPPRSAPAPLARRISGRGLIGRIGEGGKARCP